MSDCWKVMYNGTPMQKVQYQKKRIAELEAENQRLRELLIENWTDEVELLEAALQEGE